MLLVRVSADQIMSPIYQPVPSPLATFNTLPDQPHSPSRPTQRQSAPSFRPSEHPPPDRSSAPRAGTRAQPAPQHAPLPLSTPSLTTDPTLPIINLALAPRIAAPETLERPPRVHCSQPHCPNISIKNRTYFLTALNNARVQSPCPLFLQLSTHCCPCSNTATSANVLVCLSLCIYH